MIKADALFPRGGPVFSPEAGPSRTRSSRLGGCALFVVTHTSSPMWGVLSEKEEGKGSRVVRGPLTNF